MTTYVEPDEEEEQAREAAADVEQAAERAGVSLMATAILDDENVAGWSVVIDVDPVLARRIAPPATGREGAREDHGLRATLDEVRSGIDTEVRCEMITVGELRKVLVRVAEELGNDLLISVDGYEGGLTDDVGIGVVPVALNMNGVRNNDGGNCFGEHGEWDSYAQKFSKSAATAPRFCLRRIEHGCRYFDQVGFHSDMLGDGIATCCDAGPIGSDGQPATKG